VSEDKPKLLIIEDDVGLQKQLKWCFDEYEVLIAASRSDAIAQGRRHEPPVVLQDLGLPPDADGVTEGMATLKEMLTFVKATDIPGKVGYGLGIERYRFPGGVEVIGHLGSGAGYRAFVGRVPAQKIDIAMVITNPDDPTPVLFPALKLMLAEAS
jgi:CubicO group peptidase (beta-lactamase class C family)